MKPRHIYLNEDAAQLHCRPWYEAPVRSVIWNMLAEIAARYGVKYV